MNPVIEVNNISKSYQISHQAKASYNTIKDDFEKLLRKPFGGADTDNVETFWALKDISFQVNKGEIFGIVGKNGSGKSTLLKILSRIVDPSSGSIKIQGKVASLLEVGTGFHPELTGRENIYFNGSMIGMSKQEITRKFEEIVEFSGVEKFLDTPVKFYSSGMYVRLAFSVAAHLKSEILIIDEVLSVGDAQFQKKSLNKILETMNEGRTVLFVSHSLATVQQLCSRGLMLRNGRIGYIGEIGEVSERYAALIKKQETPKKIQSWWVNDGSVVNEYFVPKTIYSTTLGGEKIISSHPNNKDILIIIEAKTKRTSELLTIGIAVYNQNKMLMFMSYPSDNVKTMKVTIPNGKTRLQARIPSHYLNSGEYRVSLIGGIHNKFWLFEPGTQTPSITICVDGGLSGSPYWPQPREGYMAPIINWSCST